MPNHAAAIPARSEIPMAAQTFRPLRMDELRAAYDVYLHAFYALQNKSVRQWPRTMSVEVYEQHQLRGENFGYFVGDALAVIASLARQESADWREATGGQTHWWLKTLATAAEFHRRRLGEQMVAECETWLRERGEKKLLLDCADAGFLPHFYTRLGFQVVARKRISYPSGDAWAMVLMEKSLAVNQDRNHAIAIPVSSEIPLRLVPFDRSHAAHILSWLQTPTELAHCAGLVEPPTPAIFEKWLADPTAHGRILFTDGPVAYGELWVSESEDEAELAHILVSPHHRNRGVGRKLVQLLVDEAAGFQVSTVLVRVVPENQAAIRCYSACGFARVPDDQQAELNATQPRTYCWLSRHLRNT